MDRGDAFKTRNQRRRKDASTPLRDTTLPSEKKKCFVPEWDADIGPDSFQFLTKSTDRCIEHFPRERKQRSPRLEIFIVYVRDIDVPPAYAEL